MTQQADYCQSLSVKAVPMKVAIGFIMDKHVPPMENTQAWPWSKEQIIHFLKKKKITPTLQRIQIGEVIFSRQQHISAEQIMQQLKHQQTQISKATVYNTLALFTDKRVIKTVTLDPERVLYDSNIEFHHHVYDDENGFLMDVPNQDIVISQIPNLPLGIELQQVDVVLRVKATPEILRKRTYSNEHIEAESDNAKQDLDQNPNRFSRQHERTSQPESSNRLSEFSEPRQFHSPLANRYN